MVNDRNAFGSFPAILRGEEITCNKLDISSGIELAEHVLEAAKVTGGPNETAEIGKAVFKENFDYLCANETIGPSD
jgi:hypothetical protein